MNYVTSNKKEQTACGFCGKLNSDTAKDRENLVVYRGQTTFVAMNIYPYNTSHLMILPNDHVSVLGNVSTKAQTEMMALAAYFTNVLTQLMQPDGFNVGINMGQAAGAGIAGHLHMHLVPRWNGDSNFMSVVSNTRILPENLEDTYNKILALLKKQPPKI